MSSGAVCRHLKIAGRVAFFTVFSGYQPLLAKLATHPFGGTKAGMLSLMWAVGCLEAVGGLLILLGLFTRPVAFLLCGQMAVAYFTRHYPRGFWPVRNGGELAVLYCFIFLYLVLAGPGPVSLDRWLRKKS